MTQAIDQGNAIPADLAERKPANKNLKFIIGGFLVLGLVVILIVQATVTTGAYYLTVAELYERVPGIYGERVRVSGVVVDGSEEWNPQEITLRFSIRDGEDNDEENNTVNASSGAVNRGEAPELQIVFYGPRPDNFHRAASAIVEGEYLEDGTFKAETLLLKCPSRYEEEPEEVFVTAER